MRLNGNRLSVLEIDNLLFRLDRKGKGQFTKEDLNYLLGRGESSEIDFFKQVEEEKTALSFAFSEETTALFTYLTEVIKHCSRVEKVREQLALRRDIHLAEVFSLFDPYSKGRFTVRDFTAALNRLDIICSDSEVNCLFERYDSKRQAYLECVYNQVQSHLQNDMSLETSLF